VSVIYHLRHAMRTRPGKHLSREGVRLAREVGQGFGEFDIVVTSDLPRAIETAIAMGYASDRQVEDLGEMFSADKDLDWTQGCAAFAAAARESRRVARAAERHAEILREIAAALPGHGSALVVSHGGIIELGVVGLLPENNFASWGVSCDYCEGVRLDFTGQTCTGAAILRLADLRPPQ
jgi:broad specificity phosphatase PhoE